MPHFTAKVILLLSSVMCGSALADITEITPLSFGKVAISDNSSPQTITVTTAGNVYYSSHIHPIQTAQRGVFRLTNFPANQLLSVTTQTASPSTSSAQASSEQFSLTNIQTTTYVTTDSSGAVTTYVGGILSTSGNGSTAFSNTDFTVQYQISVNY